jgi:hypothetical protein
MARDHMPQPRRQSAITHYGTSVWEDARRFYLRVTFGVAVVCTTLGGIAGYAFAGGFN